MARMACKCGHCILDRHDNLPYKAYFFRDSDLDNFFDFSGEIGEFLNALSNNKRDEWVNKNFGGELKYSNADILSALLHNRPEIREMYQCENCGSVLIEKSNEYHFASFSPDGEDSKELFKAIN
jgi:hypothetical protein